MYSSYVQYIINYSYTVTVHETAAYQTVNQSCDTESVRIVTEWIGLTADTSYTFIVSAYRDESLETYNFTVNTTMPCPGKKQCKKRFNIAIIAFTVAYNCSSFCHGLKSFLSIMVSIIANAVTKLQLNLDLTKSI